MKLEKSDKKQLEENKSLRNEKIHLVLFFILLINLISKLGEMLFDKWYKLNKNVIGYKNDIRAFWIHNVFISFLYICRFCYGYCFSWKIQAYKFKSL